MIDFTKLQKKQIVEIGNVIKPGQFSMDIDEDIIIKEITETDIDDLNKITVEDIKKIKCFDQNKLFNNALIKKRYDIKYLIEQLKNNKLEKLLQYYELNN